MYYLETAQPSYTTPLPVNQVTRSTEPTEAQEPITLAEAKRQCQVAEDVTAFDDEIRHIVSTAREQLESDTGIVCYTGTFTWKQTDFPSCDWWEIPQVRPVTSISSITYIDTAGATQTWSSSSYALQTAGVNQYIRLAYGESWPTPRGDLNGITVTLVAGYSSVAAMPRWVKEATRLAVQSQWMARMEADPRVVREAYERVIVARHRSTYP